MDGTVVETGVGSALAALRVAVDGLLSAGLTGLASTEVTALLTGVEVQRRRLEAVDHRLLAEVEQRRVAGDYARTSTADLLVSLLRVSPREAKARVCAGVDAGPRRAFNGEPLEPIFPLVAAAQAEGAISAAHAGAVRQAVDAIPAALAAAAAPVAERLLLDVARHCEPTVVARTGRDLLARLDPDGTAPTDHDHQRRRGLTLAEHRDGTGHLSGELTAECLAVWRTVIGALAAPAPAEESGERDDRSPAQRRHDAFLDAGRRLLRSATLPESGGIPVTVTATMTATQLREQTGYATTSHGELISVTALLHAATEADIIPAVLDDTGGVLAYGRTHRYATGAQRRALAARDHGCAFPACTRPASWCEAHHIVPWHQDGRTDLDNLVLLCGFHHREHAARGWVIRMTDGVPLFIPPAWLDPDQIPIRNRARHLDHIHFPDLGLSKPA